MWPAVCCLGWDFGPHEKITAAALEALPAGLRQQFGPEARLLVEVYCMLPDRYAAAEQYGFIANGPGPRTPEELQVYCVRPDGVPIHGATWNRDEDLPTLVYLLERIGTGLGRRDQVEAARYAGVLSHFIADTLSPPHAVPARRLQSMAPAGCRTDGLHRALERSMPEIRPPSPVRRLSGDDIVAAAAGLLNRLYVAAARNRRDLPLMVRATCASNESAVDPFRARAGSVAAELLAAALRSVPGSDAPGQ